MSSREKRERAAPQRFETGFKVSEPVAVAAGAGTALQDIEASCENIKARGLDDEALISLHTAVFGRRPKRTLVKKNLLQWSGLAASDEGAKAKLDAKIQKWKLPVIKDACDVLGVSRSEAPDKGTLTARLLDFLVEPSAAAATGSKRKSAASGGAKKKQKKAAKEEAEEEEEEEEEEVDEALKERLMKVKASLSKDELDTMTIKQLMVKLSEDGGDEVDKAAVKNLWLKLND